MRSSLFIALAAAVAVLPARAAAQAYADEDRDWGVEASATLRRPPYSAPTPTRIPGGSVLTTVSLNRMIKSGERPALIDVASGEGHVSIAGASWIPGAGHGTHFLDPLQALLKERLAKLSNGDMSRPLVFFCVNSQCWLSYNAALRAVAMGFSRVYWYRGGVEAWRKAGLPLARVASEIALDAPPREGKD